MQVTRGSIFFGWARAAAAVALAVVGATSAPAQGPVWWDAREVFTVDPLSGIPLPPSEYAAINHGQLKHLACAAYDELNARLAGGAGPAVTVMVKSWHLLDGAGEIALDPFSGARVPQPDPAAFSVVNVGQLKEVARPFYARLIEAGLVAAVPWAGAPPGADYAMANIGQAKALFAFRATPSGPFDADGDGMADEWELAYFGDLTAAAGDDADGDGVSNLAEYQSHTHPRDFYDRRMPIVSLTGGNGQAVAPTVSVPLPLSVRVLHPGSGAPWVNAPVSFVVASGGGGVAPPLATTASDGTASSVFTAPAFDATSTVVARVSSAGQTAHVSFTVQSISPPAPSNLHGAGGPTAADSILLTWVDNSTTETGFVIEKQNPDGTWTVVGEVAANVTQFEYVPSGGTGN